MTRERLHVKLRILKPFRSISGQKLNQIVSRLIQKRKGLWSISAYSKHYAGYEQGAHLIIDTIRRVVWSCYTLTNSGAHLITATVRRVVWSCSILTDHGAHIITTTFRRVV